jgi:superoxide dismutase
MGFHYGKHHKGYVDKLRGPVNPRRKKTATQWVTDRARVWHNELSTSENQGVSP